MNLQHVFDFSREAGGEYFYSVFSQRTKGHSLQAGSYYDMSEGELLSILENSDWEETNEVIVGDGKKVYKTYLSGYFGMVHVDELSDDAVLYTADPKGTGYSSVIFEEYVPHDIYDETYMIVSVNDDGTEFILTVFPGPDIPPYEVSTDAFDSGISVTKEEIINAGIRYVKTR